MVLYTYEELDSTAFNVDFEQTSTLEWYWTSTRTSPEAIQRNSAFNAVGLPIQHSIQPYEIVGTALDNNEDPVAGATVYLIPGNYRIPNAIQKAVADGSGDYRFYVEDPNDEYTIVAYKPNGDEIRGVTARTLKGEAT